MTHARSQQPIPGATLARLPGYLRVLAELSADGTHTVSSDQLAHACGVHPAQLRRDLSSLGSYGTRGVGYDVDTLRAEIGDEIGWTHDWPVVIVGLGNLGSALAGHAGFSARGFRVVALIDADPAREGELLHGHRIQPMERLAEVVALDHPAIGVIATPVAEAQKVCDALVAAGITSVLNFAPTTLTVPPQVTVRTVDLGLELQILAYHAQVSQDPRQAVVDPTSGGASRASLQA